MVYPPQAVSTTSRFPPDVYHAAQQAQLGDQPGAEYRPQTTTKGVVGGIFGILVGLVFITGGILVWIGLPDISGLVLALILGLLGMIPLGFGLYAMAYGSIYQGWGAYVYPQGFVYKAGNKPAQPFRWDQIEAAWHSVVRHSYNGIPTGTTHTYRVRRVDGFEVVLNDRFHNVSQLGKLVHERITAIKLPQALAAYNAGQTITFGFLSVNTQGIFTDNGKFLPWGEIKAVSIESGYLAIRKAGQWRRWSARPISVIPNLFLFLALVNRVLEKQR